MSKKFLVTFVALMALLTLTATGQDAKAVIASASRAMGIEGLNSIHFYGVAQNGNLGQNNNSNQPWPMAGANDYVRAIDFTQPASRATWQTYAVPVTGGAATLAPGQQNITAQNNTWAQQLEIWITPWGFLKGAAANNATVRAQIVNGKRYQEVTFNSPIKSPGGQPYKVVGFINNQNLVEKVQTWLENPVFGDMFVEDRFFEPGLNLFNKVLVIDEPDHLVRLPPGDLIGDLNVTSWSRLPFTICARTVALLAAAPFRKSISIMQILSCWTMYCSAP